MVSTRLSNFLTEEYKGINEMWEKFRDIVVFAADDLCEKRKKGMGKKEQHDGQHCGMRRCKEPLRRRKDIQVKDAAHRS